VMPFADGHTRQLPRLTRGPFRYQTYADGYLAAARDIATRPVKQAVISASALSLLYPEDSIDGYPRDAFLADLLGEVETDIRRSLAGGAHCVQIDFTEARLSLKLDPSGGLLRSFVELNNDVLRRFSADERSRLGVHTCPGGDNDSTHSADVAYEDLLPTLFELKVANFYVQLASEPDRARVLGTIRDNLRQACVCSWASSIRSMNAWRRRRRPATGCSRRRNPFRSTSSGRPMTAASPRSATTRQPHATPHSRRSLPACRARL
jgi:5-methyltetrahydropteroyltriglutamate--homocysteine methyltransferase